MDKLLTITGSTACGKTALAVGLALYYGGEIISADSRQVFCRMDLGTGKDLADYCVDGRQVPYHLIDIRQPGEEYSVYQFQNDFLDAYRSITSRGNMPIICGGTGLYIESVVKGYQLSNAPVDEEFRASLQPLSDQELTARLASYVKLHNHTDTENRERLVRALEIEEYRRAHPDDFNAMPQLTHVVVGVLYPREVVVARIEERLKQRLDSGMVQEVQQLIDSGVPTERLLRYGLEYKNITRYLLNECTYEEMYTQLFTEIRRFSKRQMTWFRHMQRQGTVIHWIDGTLPYSDKLSQVMSIYDNA